MDIKVSRFEKKNEFGFERTIEEIIPNEEPLIQIRQFCGIGATSSQHGLANTILNHQRL